jgi:hypothetical protein
MVKAVGAIELIAGVGGEVEDTVGQGDPHPPWKTLTPSPWKTLTPSPWKTLTPSLWKTLTPSPWKTLTPSPLLPREKGSKRGVFFFL